MAKDQTDPIKQIRSLISGADKAGHRALLLSLLSGGEGLPSARERWVALLTDASPMVRLEAERSLLAALRDLDSPAPAAPREKARAPRVEAARSVELPSYLPYKEPSEPWRHCRACFGHDFWLNRAGEAFCTKCAPPRPEEPLEPWRFCRGCHGSDFWFDRAGSPICLRCSPPAPPGSAM